MIRRLLANDSIRRLSVISMAKIVAAGMQAVTFALIARALGVSQFGVFSVGYSATLICLSLLEFGFGNRALRVAADARSRSVVGTIVSIRAATNFLTVIAVSVVLAATTELSLAVTVLLTVYVTGEMFANLCQSILIGFFREKLGAVLLVARRLLVLGLIGAMAIFGESDLAGTYLCLGVVGLAGYLVGVISIARNIGAPMNPFRFIATNRRFWTASVASNLQQADSLVIASVGGAYLAGLYGAAARLTSPLNLMTSSILQSVVPKMAGQSDPVVAAAFHGKIMRVLFGYAGVLALFSALAPVVILVLYGEEYIEAWPIGVAVFLVASINAVIQGYLSWYYSNGITRRVPIIQAAWTASSLLSLFLGGVVGSVWVVSAGLVVSALLALAAYLVGFRADRRGGSDLR